MTAVYNLSKSGHSWIPNGLSIVGIGNVFSRSDTLEEDILKVFVHAEDVDRVRATMSGR